MPYLVQILNLGGRREEGGEEDERVEGEWGKNEGGERLERDGETGEKEQASVQGRDGN